MRTLVFVSFCVLILTSPRYSQTQLLKVGNAVQYSFEGNQTWVVISTNKITLNNKEYFERKNYSPWINQIDYTTSFERMEGDSVYYMLSASNSDSLVFNFNWQVGQILLNHLSGNYLFERRIDSIIISSIYIPQDTIYYIGNYSINIITGDTSTSLPPYNTYSKKIGKLNDGLWIFYEGAKIDGLRYGTVFNYPEELVFSADSIYIPTLADSGSTQIVNTSDSAVRIDSIISVGSFYGYHGNFSRPGFEYPFYFVQTAPGFTGDTLGIVIPPHDSINVSFYEVDLCPMCNYEIQDYFKDTLRFVFTFLDGNVYSFSKSIQISGEGHPSDVTDDKILPTKFVLEQNYPNPFNPSTVISYQLPISGQVTLKIYDVLGNDVAILVNEYRNAGSYEVDFDASNLSSGVYYYQLRAGSFVDTKKMIFIK